MNKLNNKFRKAFGLAILCGLASFSAMAQTYGFSYVGKSPSTAVGGHDSISSDSAIHYQYHISLPGNLALSAYSNLSIRAVGGIEIYTIDSTNNNITIKSKTDTLPSSGYLKYAKGRIYISCEAPTSEDCETYCPFYNPYFSYSYDVYKLFDITRTDNEVVGPICVTAGDTVTYSVEPWVSIDRFNIGIDRYKWELPASLVDTVLYYSADSSSITFVIDELSTTVPDSVKVQLGKCNFGAANHLSWIVLNQAVPKPIITGDLCAKSGTQTVELRVQNIDLAATYTWSKSNANWSFIGDVVGDTIQLTTDESNSCDINVKAIANNGCVSSSTFSISRCN